LGLAAGPGPGRRYTVNVETRKALEAVAVLHQHELGLETGSTSPLQSALLELTGEGSRSVSTLEAMRRLHDLKVPARV